MTSWKRRMLDTLYLGAERTLTQGPPQASSRIEAARASVRALWGEARSSVFIEHFTSGLPERYFYANEPESIVEHARFAEAAQSRVASIRRGSVNHPYFELWVVADDRPGLLAMITATLRRGRLELRSAQVYSWVGQDGRSRSLDIFWVRGPEDSGDEEPLHQLERELEKILSGALDPAELERRALAGARYHRARKTHFPTTVHIDNQSSSNHTVVEVITQDRPALLFCLANALQQLGLSIWFAKINTEGERVVDVFYVSTSSGQKLFDGEQRAQIRQAICSAVERLEAQALGPGLAAAIAG
jgi:[protein-PII] uridylyltransferase